MESVPDSRADGSAHRLNRRSNRHHRPRRRARRRADPEPAVPGRGRPRLRQDHARAAVPAGGRPDRASRCSTSRCPRPRRSCAPRPHRTAGRSTASTIRELRPRRGQPPARRRSTRCSIPPRSSWARRLAASWPTVERIKPTRVVFDSLSELRLLAENPLRYRRQILALKQFFAGRSCTVLLLDDLTGRRPRPPAAEHRARRDPPRADCIPITARAPAAARHQVPRTATSAAATTTSSSDAAGSRCFPRLVAAEHRQDSQSRTSCAAASAALDALLGGGLDARHQHAASSAPPAPASRRSPRSSRRPPRRAGRAARCSSSTRAIQTLLTRAAGLGHRSRRSTSRPGTVSVQPVDPAELSPGEFAHSIRRRRRRAGRARSSSSTA